MGEGTLMETIVENSSLHLKNFDSSTLDLAYHSLNQMEALNATYSLSVARLVRFSEQNSIYDFYFAFAFSFAFPFAFVVRGGIISP